jgi:hypothetical protein
VLAVSPGGADDWRLQQCHIAQHAHVVGGELLDTVAGLKMYTPEGTCCEACTTRPQCRLWHSQERKLEFSSNCSLFKSGRIERLETKPGLRNAQSAGLAFPTAMPRRRFLGCGWDIVSAMHPCVDGGTDDMPHNGRHLPMRVDPWTPGQNRDALKACTRWGSAPREAGAGRWVRSSAAVSSKCSHKDSVLAAHFDHKHKVNAHHPDQPEECWIHDNLRELSGVDIEASANMYRSSVWNTSATSKTPAAAVFGPAEGRMDFRYSWEPNGCRLKLLTDADITQCLTERPGVFLEGAAGQSIAKYIGMYLNVRLADLRHFRMLGNRTFTKQAPPPHTPEGALLGPRSRVLHLDTFQMPHQLWHNSDAQWMEFIRKLPNADATNRRVFIDGPLYSSHREEHVSEVRRRYVPPRARAWGGAVGSLPSCTISCAALAARVGCAQSAISAYVRVAAPMDCRRGTTVRPAHSHRSILPHRRHFMKLAALVLEVKGWEPIDLTQISAGLTFDAATQNDGLHVAGPPMKVVTHIVLNILCSMNASTP